MDKNFIRKKTGSVYKLLPMKENEENWKEQLDYVISDFKGLYQSDILGYSENSVLIDIIGKLTSLHDETIDFKIYRKIIFDTISLLQGLIDDEF